MFVSDLQFIRVTCTEHKYCKRRECLHYFCTEMKAYTVHQVLFGRSESSSYTETADCATRVQTVLQCAVTGVALN
jgi:hypothetical protein